MKSNVHSRRSFAKRFSLGAAGLAFARFSAASGRTVKRFPLTETIKFGVASYSLRTLSRQEAIAAMQELGVSYISVKSFHLPYEDTSEELGAGRKQFEAAGIRIVSGGVITFRRDVDEDVQKYFDYARYCGMPMMIISTTAEILPRIESFVKKYDIKVAIHNHGPEDENFPAPADALSVIKDMDPRIGVCVDVGHTSRTGTDVVAAIADAGDRLLDVHIKDLRDLMEQHSDCIVGEGAMPVADIFRQLQNMQYDGYVNLEYEIDADFPIPGMKLSFAYMRGVLAGLAG